MKKHLLGFLLLFFITSLFFYPILKGYIPFPGDLLVGGYEPYKSYTNLGYAPGGVPNKAQGPDIIREAFPWKSFVIDSLKKGQVPFWNPYNFSGNPLMANFQSAVFYPLNLIFFILPFLSAWSLLIFLGPFLAALFTYLFLQELKLSKISSIFGGVVFGFSSYMVVWLQYGNITHTFLWLPLALLFTQRLTKHFSKKNLLFLLLALCASVLGGYIQGYFYTAILVAFYFLFKNPLYKPENFKKTAILGTIILSPILLSLFQFLQTLEVFTYSTRVNYTLSQINNLLNPAWYMITVIIPDFFGNPAVRNYWFNGTYIERVSYFGVIPFVLALSALLSFRKNKEIKIFGFLFALTFIISVDLFFTKYIYTLPIPMLSTTVPTRILGTFQFCGAILAAFGLEFFLQKKDKRNLLIPSVSILTLVLGICIFSVLSKSLSLSTDWVSHFAVIKRNTMLPLLFISVFTLLVFLRFSSNKFFETFSKRGWLFGTIVLVFTIGDLFYFFHKVTPFSPKEFVYPQTEVVSYLQNNAGEYRFWGYGSAYINPNFQTFDKTFSPEGDDPLHLKSYTELLEASKNGKLPDVLPRPDANVAAGYGQQDLDKNYYRQKVLNVIGVKYIVHKDESLGSDMRPDTATFNQKKYTLVWQKTPFQVYENLHVLPRTFLTTDFLIVKDKEKIFQTLFGKDFDEKKTIILDADPDLKKTTGNTQQTTGKAEIASYTPNNVIIKTNSDEDTLLFLSDNYYPEWKASVDGKETRIYKADYTFRAIVLPKGQHEVVFYYDAANFRKGLIASAIFALLLIVFFIKYNLKKI